MWELRTAEWEESWGHLEMPLPVLLQNAASLYAKSCVNSAERPRVTQVRLRELTLHFMGTEIPPSLSTVSSKLLQIYPSGAMKMSHFFPLKFTSTSRSPNEGQRVGRTLEETSLVGLALLIAKTNTSCCPRAYREDCGSCGLEKNRKGAAKKHSCKANALCWLLSRS